MIIDNLKLVYDNLIEKIKNPFGGTFIVAWSLYNWKLLIGIIEFKDEKLINYIENYLAISTSSNLFWEPLLSTFAAILLFQVFSHLALIIFTFFSKWIKPLVFYLVDRNKIVDKSSYDSMKMTAIKLQTDIELLNEAISKHKLETENLNKINEDIKKESHDKILYFNKIKESLNLFLFSGKWENRYFDTITREEGVEKFEIKNRNEYYINDTLKFKIVNIEVNINDNTIKFDKIDVSNNSVVLKNNLIIKNENYFEGTENEKILIRYLRIYTRDEFDLGYGTFYRNRDRYYGKYEEKNNPRFSYRFEGIFEEEFEKKITGYTIETTANRRS